MPLNKAEIDAVLEAALKPKPAKTEPGTIRKYAPPPQKGPLRRYDHEMRCLSKRCGSPTYIKVEGVALCTSHALKALNELVTMMTERREHELMQGPVGDGEQLTLVSDVG